MHVSKPVLIVFGCALVAALMVIAYQLGRDHGRRHVVADVSSPNPNYASPSPSPNPSPSPSPGYTYPPPSAAPPATARPQNPYNTDDEPQLKTFPGPAAPSPPSSGNSGTSADAAAVRTYFQQMDQLAAASPFGNDTQGAAQSLLASAMSGDMSGFDAMAKLATDGIAKAQAMTPPAACAHYHQESIAMLQDSVQIVAGLRNAIANKDTGAMMSIAATSQSMQSKLSALEHEATEIKSRYGIR